MRKSPYFSGSTVHGVTLVSGSGRSSAADLASHSLMRSNSPSAGSRSTIGVNCM